MAQKYPPTRKQDDSAQYRIPFRQSQKQFRYDKIIVLKKKIRVKEFHK